MSVYTILSIEWILTHSTQLNWMHQLYSTQVNWVERNAWVWVYPYIHYKTAFLYICKSGLTSARGQSWLRLDSEAGHKRDLRCQPRPIKWGLISQLSLRRFSWHPCTVRQENSKCEKTSQRILRALMRALKWAPTWYVSADTSTFISYPDLIQRLAIKGISGVSWDMSSGGSF